MPIRILLPIVTLLLTCSLAGAEMYQWVDEHGAVTFKDTPPPATKKGKKVKVYTDGDFIPAPFPPPVSSPRRATPALQPAPPVKQRFTGTVELYVTDWCGYSKLAERYLQGKGVSYVAYDIEKDGAAMQRHKDLGGAGRAADRGGLAQNFRLFPRDHRLLSGERPLGSRPPAVSVTTGA